MITLSKVMNGLLRHRILNVQRSFHFYAVPCLIKQRTQTLQRRYLSETATHDPLPNETRVVICGGGVVGASLAYHLSERGCNDVLLLEQGSLGCGTSWHSAAMIGQVKTGDLETALVRYSRQLFETLENEGHYVGWRKCGSIQLARNSVRLTTLRQLQAIMKANGLESNMVTPSEVGELSPLTRTDDLEGALYIPSDGFASPTDIINTFAKLSRQNGVKIVEGCQVTKVNTYKGRVTGVETDKGSVKCETFVNTGGIWSREIGKLSEPNVPVPQHPMEHYHVVTKAIPNIPKDEAGRVIMPVIRDYDGMIYIRQCGEGIMAGGFEPKGNPVFHSGISPKFEHALFPDDWDHFQVLLEQIIHRIPALENTEVQQLTNGPESFTEDGRFIYGESPQIQNYFLATAMNSFGIASSGGTGKYLADRILDGRFPLDILRADIRRLHPCENNHAWLRDTAITSIGRHVSMNIPSNLHSSLPPLRTSPLHLALEQQGAVFVNPMSYACPVYFIESKKDRDAVLSAQLLSKPAWFSCVESEYWSCKDDIALVDKSALSKFEITSENGKSTAFMQKICSNNMAVPVGSVFQTCLLNVFGGCESYGTVARTDEHSYFLSVSPDQHVRCLSWLERHLPADCSVAINDLSSRYSCISITGKHSRDLLCDVFDGSLQHSDLPCMTTKVMDLGYVSDVRVLHNEEDSFMLYLPHEFTLGFYKTLKSAGEKYHVIDAGLVAKDLIRLDRLQPAWGVDFKEINTPLESFPDWTVDLQKGDFMGRDALLRDQSEGIEQKLVQFEVGDLDIHTDMWPWGREPIFRNDQFVGTTTSCGYSYGLQKLVCFSFVRNIDGPTQTPVKTTDIDSYIRDSSAKYTINIAGKVHRLLLRQ